MKNYLLILTAIMTTFVISAQKVKYYAVQAGQILIEAVLINDTYEYAEFQERTVNF